MADYYTPTQLALKVGTTEAQIAELEAKGFLHPALKDRRRFLSSREAHDLQVALRLARKQRVSLQQAFVCVEEMRLCQVNAAIGS